MSIRRTLLVILSVLLVGAISTGCGINPFTNPAPVNYAGDGNEFTVTGVIASVDDESVTLVPTTVQVTSSDGVAVDWFKDSNPYTYGFTVHNSYRFGDHATPVVGIAYNPSGNPTALSSLQPGDTVSITGKIRESYNTLNHAYRAVFDRLDVQP